MWSEKARHALEAIEGDSEKTLSHLNSITTQNESY